MKEQTLEIISHEYGQLISNKSVKPIQWEKDNLFQQVVLKQLDICVQGKKKKRTLTLS